MAADGGAYPPGARVGPMGYAPWSEGLGIVLRRLHDELPGRPLLICEHGIGTDDDEWRCDVLRESLAIVDEARKDGVDVRGFFHWTGVDNYEWMQGFDVSFGCFTREREPRASAELLREYAQSSRPDAE
jgi:beta-glucosidase